MNRKVEQEPEVVECDACRTIPLSHLSLDVDEPIDGWMGFFGEENIEIAPDDLGRPSVPRSVLRELVDERERLRPGGGTTG